jgi:hypothetical protein
MALDAVRGLQFPDHGLVSSYHALQPPGLVWVTTPFVALGGGRPEVVIVGFALLNALAIGALVATAARFWGLLYGAALGGFLVVGPDAFISAWVWHPSLYTAATSLLLIAGIRLRHDASPWWAAALVALPGCYAAIHYSGLVLFAPALALLLLAHRSWRALWRPILGGGALVALAWMPFLVFEARRDWIDLRTVIDAADSSSTIAAKLRERAGDLSHVLVHLGQAMDGPVYLTRLLAILVAAGVVIALVRRRWREPGFVLPAAMLAAGVAAQVILDQGERRDVLFLWLVPLYALASWGVVQLVDLMPSEFARRAAVPIGAIAIGLVVAVGSVDMVDSIRAIPDADRLSAKWSKARADTRVRYRAAVKPGLSVNRFFLPCDPPYDWGSEVWYLREVLEPGRGIAEALSAGAFRARQGSACGLRATAPSRWSRRGSG